LSSFLARVLDQLAVTAWLPAVMLVGVLALLVELFERPDLGLDIPAALERLANAPWGTIIVLVFAVILTTMITQAFSFGGIRLLEGYWGHRGINSWFTRRAVGRQARRLAHTKERVIKLEQQTFISARPKLIGPVPREQLDHIEQRVFRIPKEQWVASPEAQTKAASVKWRSQADPSIVAVLDRAYARVSTFPRQPHRLLPTSLGNMIRAHEDKLNQRGGELEGFLMRNYSAFPARLLAQHDQWRDRLEMYSILVYVFLALSLAAAVLLAELSPYYSASLGGAALFLLLAWLSYRAALASARGYGAVLVSMKTYVDKATQKPG
jgi:hypothetical protein